MMACILLKPMIGKFGALNRFPPLSDVAVDAGSLWREIEDSNVSLNVFHKFRRSAGQDGMRAYESIEERNLYIIGSPEHLGRVPIQWAEMLLAVPDLKERLLLCRTENTLYCASRLSIGDAVNVQLATGKIIPGRLRWIGQTAMSRHGNLFGVEVAPGCGMTDGMCNGVRYFKCGPGSALFVPVSLLWFPPPSAASSPASMTIFYDERNGLSHNAANGSRSEPTGSTRASWLIDLRSPKDQQAPKSLPMMNEATNGQLRKWQNLMDRTLTDQSPATSALPPLTVGERVVFLRDGNTEYGTVRWIGHIPGFEVEMAGVEFDNPVGSGSGMYNGKRLFYSRMNHATLMPIGGLIRAVDFDRDTTGYSSIQKNLLVEFEGMNDTTVWSADQVETSSESPSPPLVDTSGEDLEPRVRQLLAMDQHHINVGAHVQARLDVNITTPSLVYYGIVRWIGNLPGKDGPMVGVEVEKDLPYWIRSSSDGTYQSQRYFSCESRRGVFLPVDQVRVRADVHGPDGRKWQDSAVNESMPDFPGPWKLHDVRRIGQLIGKGKGIQGKSNSCYLDATLFALFTGTDAFDGILSRPKSRTDIELYDEIRTCLKFKIVSPLRWIGYVEQEAVMNLRRLIAYVLPDIRGWTDEEKDPEELINALFGPILCVDPDIRLTTGQSSHICQLIVEDSWQKTTLTSVQTLLERSFFCSNVQLKSVPNRFIVQLPRYGKQKLYDYIVPTLTLDLSNILANRERQCGSCGERAQWQCKECYLVETNEYAMTFFCNLCFGKFHSALRTNNDHQPSSIARPAGPIDLKSKPSLELASVVCIESSHYVSFVRVRGERSSKWLFFDSMADREGGDITGHNIPEVVGCDDFFDHLLHPQNRHLLIDALPVKGSSHSRRSSNPLPPGIERLMQDCYVCIYTRQPE